MTKRVKELQQLYKTVVKNSKEKRTLEKLGFSKQARDKILQDFSLQDIKNLHKTIMNQFPSINKTIAAAAVMKRCYANTQQDIDSVYIDLATINSYRANQLHAMSRQLTF